MNNNLPDIFSVTTANGVISGSPNVRVYDANGKLKSVGGGGSGTVTSIDVNGGTGISVSPAGPITTSGTFTVTNTAPDQTVVLTGGVGISVSGTYPSFTITNTGTIDTLSPLLLMGG